MARRNMNANTAVMTLIPHHGVNIEAIQASMVAMAHAAAINSDAFERVQAFNFMGRFLSKINVKINKIY
jgi:hypothetical protein